MSEDDRPVAEKSLPDAKVRQRHGLSAIWLVPLVALIIAAWLGYRNFIDQGPLIKITFTSAEGIEAGRTKVKFKDVEVGEIEHVQVTQDPRACLGHRPHGARHGTLHDRGHTILGGKAQSG